MSESLGVAMVGFGWMGRVHATAHVALPLVYDPAPARTRLIGVSATTQESGEKAVRQAGFAFATTDWKALVARSDVDIVHICAPNDAHFAPVMAALLAGKHVYCEKPLALTVGEAEQIVALGRTVPTVQQVTFQYRFVPAVLRARQLVESGFLGELYSFRAAYLHAGYIDPNRAWAWRMSFARSGGGAIADLGAHVIDMVRFLVGPSTNVASGGEFESVQADLQTRIPFRPDAKTGAMRRVDVDDIALAQCRLTGGATGTLEASRLATGVQDELRIELHGSRGGLRFNLMEPNWLDAYDATKPEAGLGGERGYTRIECTTRYPKPYALGAAKSAVGWINFHLHSVFDFVSNVAAVREVDTPTREEADKVISSLSPTFADGLAAQRVIAACQQSAAQDGQRIAIASEHNP